MSEANDYSYNIASVEKTIRLIELLAETNGELSVLQIAKRLDTHASSADRFLITLQNLGYVDKCEQIGKYRLTDRLLKIASNLIVSHPLTVRYLDVMHTGINILPRAEKHRRRFFPAAVFFYVLLRSSRYSSPPSVITA